MYNKNTLQICPEGGANKIQHAVDAHFTALFIKPGQRAPKITGLAHICKTPCPLKNAPFN